MTDIAMAGAPETAHPGRLFQGFRWLVRHPPAFTLLLILFVCLVVGTLNPAFWQVSNLFDMARASVVRGLFALGVLCVLAAGGSMCRLRPSRRL